jgi:hypothetical protein
MSSDPNQPNPEWWKSQDPQEDQDPPAPQGNQGNEGYQETQAYQRPPAGNQGYQEPQPYQGYQDPPAGNQGYQGPPAGNQDYQGPPQGNQDYQGPPPGYQGAQGNQGYQGPPQGNQGFQGSQGDQGYWGPQGNQGYQGSQGNQAAGQDYQGQGYQGAQAARQDYQDSQRTQNYQMPQGNQGNQGYQGPQGTQGFPGSQGYPEGQGFPGGQGYQAAQDYPGPPPRVRRRRRRKWPIITLIVIIVILVVGDRVGCAIAENQMASQIQQQGFPAKPHVTIEGIPFLTQLAQKDFKDVVISASNVTEGPLDIASLNATIHGMHINSSFSGATVDSINGTALITFTALANVGGIPGGITLTADGPNEVKATINADVITETVVAKVIKTGPTTINVHVVQAGDLPSSILGNLANFNVNVPKSALPAGLTIQSVSVTAQGVLITVTGHNTTLSE